MNGGSDCTVGLGGALTVGVLPVSVVVCTRLKLVTAGGTRGCLYLTNTTYTQVYCTGQPRPYDISSLLKPAGSCSPHPFPHR